jgi:hypothetical protein
MAFRPEDGELFSTRGGLARTLVILDPATGFTLQTIGNTGITGPKGLAFVPEPAPALLVVCGLFALGLRSAGQRRMWLRA